VLPRDLWPPTPTDPSVDQVVPLQLPRTIYRGNCQQCLSDMAQQQLSGTNNATPTTPSPPTPATSSPPTTSCPPTTAATVKPQSVKPKYGSSKRPRKSVPLMISHRPPSHPPPNVTAPPNQTIPPCPPNAIFLAFSLCRRSQTWIRPCLSLFRSPLPRQSTRSHRQLSRRSRHQPPLSHLRCSQMHLLSSITSNLCRHTINLPRSALSPTSNLPSSDQTSLLPPFLSSHSFFPRRPLMQLTSILGVTISGLTPALTLCGDQLQQTQPPTSDFRFTASSL
jgi:hypothetical protein